MTIAAGFLCSDGIILGADTRHTEAYEGIFEASKAYRGTTPEPESASYVIVACGAAEYNRMAMEHIKAALDEPQRSLGFVATVEEAVRGVHQHAEVCQHPEGEYPWIELLIGYHPKGSVPVLYHVNPQGAVAPAAHTKFIGSGSGIANAFHRVMRHGSWTREIVRQAAMFIFYEAKKSGDGTGGDTHLYMLPTLDKGGLWDDAAVSGIVEDAMRISLVDCRDIEAVSDLDLDRKLDNLMRRIREIRVAVLNQRRMPP
jgi:hypothetical protein